MILTAIVQHDKHNDINSDDENRQDDIRYLLLLYPNGRATSMANCSEEHNTPYPKN